MDIYSIIAIVSLIISIVALIPLYFLRKQIFAKLRNLWPKDFVAVYGPEGAGKTTLVCHLTGKVLPTEHNPTLGAISVGKIVFDLTGEEIHYFRTREMFDVGGEFYLSQWRRLIRENNPDGIIYIIDTKVEDKDKEEKYFNELYEAYVALTEDMPPEKIRLKVILILMNKVDIWGTKSEEIRSKVDSYKTKFLPITDSFKRLLQIEIMFEYVSLTDVEQVPRTNEVLRRFSQRYSKGHK